MLFELNNPAAERVTHCGVLEFVADEGLIYLPYWVCFLSVLTFKLWWFSLCFASYSSVPFGLSLVDDGKHASARGRHSASEECKLSKGNVCEATATHQGLLRYLQPQSNVSQLLCHF